MPSFRRHHLPPIATQRTRHYDHLVHEHRIYCVVKFQSKMIWEMFDVWWNILSSFQVNRDGIRYRQSQRCGHRHDGKLERTRVLPRRPRFRKRKGFQNLVASGWVWDEDHLAVKALIVARVLATQNKHRWSNRKEHRQSNKTMPALVIFACRKQLKVNTRFSQSFRNAIRQQIIPIHPWIQCWCNFAILIPMSFCRRHNTSCREYIILSWQLIKEEKYMERASLFMKNTIHHRKIRIICDEMKLCTVILVNSILKWQWKMVAGKEHCIFLVFFVSYRHGPILLPFENTWRNSTDWQQRQI